MRLLFWLAIIPSILLSRYVLAYDRIEKEPFGLLARLFALGMFTCLPAGIIESVGVGFIARVASSRRMISLLTYLVLVPLAEEGVKYMALRTTHNNRNFNYTFDGIVYGTMVGLGFATLENVLYVMQFPSIQTAVMRGLLSVPLHCTCGVFMGYFYGVARGQEARGSADEAQRARMAALVVPWLIHGIYDYSLDTESFAALIAGLVLTLFVFWTASRQVRMASANDTPIAVGLTELGEPLPHKGYGISNVRSGKTPPPFNRG